MMVFHDDIIIGDNVQSCMFIVNVSLADGIVNVG